MANLTIPTPPATRPSTVSFRRSEIKAPPPVNGVDAAFTENFHGHGHRSVGLIPVSESPIQAQAPRVDCPRSLHDRGLAARCGQVVLVWQAPVARGAACRAVGAATSPCCKMNPVSKVIPSRMINSCVIHVVKQVILVEKMRWVGSSPCS